MNIILFKGQSQYDALRFFIDYLKKALEKRKHNIFLLDMLENGWDIALNEVLVKNSIDLIIDFNGIASEIKIQNQSVYDALNIYYLAIYVDHPAYHMQRLCMPNMHYLASFIDKNHVEFVQKTIPNSQKLKFFLPHAGKNVCKIKNLKDYQEIKSIDILFTGSAPNMIEKTWKDSSSVIVANMMEKMANIMEKDMDMDLVEIFDRVELDENILLSSIGEAQYAKYLHFPITYLRKIRRKNLFKALCESGLNITVCGVGWEDMVKKYKNVTYAGTVGMEKNLELMSKSKILVHNNIDFSRGSHERVFNAMLNNTFVFSDKSEYYDKFFKDGEDIIYYKFSSLSKDIKKLNVLLCDDEKLYQMTKKPKIICEEYHTWNNRAKTIEDIYEYVKLLDK